MPSANCQVDFKAITLHQQGRTDEALRLLDRAIGHTPDRGSLWLVRAIIRHGAAQWSRALADIEMAMTLMPLPIGGQLVLADCYSHHGKHELALMGYENLLAQRPLPADIYAGLYAGLRRCGRSDLALRACRAAVDLDPGNHAAYSGMAHCMAALNYSAVYIAAVLRSAVELAPDNAAYRTSLAIQLHRARQPEEAYNELSHVAPRDLDALECRCSARALMELCLWAADEQRAAALAAALRRLDSK